MVRRSSFFVLHFLAELHSQENPSAELLAQLEQAEPTEAQPTGPAPAPAEVPHVEPETAPPAASCPALGPQPESVAAPSPAAVLGHPVVARWLVSPPELRLGSAPGPLPLFPSLMLALVLVFTIALISWFYINNRTSFE
ncbi:ral guanine nucleotide dissociation stimulator-like [Heterocephalus glaber]|uniref:Ral guanine nucleotide dissociation stimulator-like n=1 Tax=Heterocephalus glaber TaxID=10181 RepID=A0AAX6RUX6_HETGA|nr:ral guanine nucleotide dissociation stimulator-like [Heterocephalus glaber]